MADKTVLPNLWKRKVIAEQFRWWLSTKIRILALFLVLIKGFLQSVQLYIALRLGLRGSSDVTTHNASLCTASSSNPSDMRLAVLCISGSVTWVHSYSESLRSIIRVNSTNCTYYDKHKWRSGCCQENA